jgi:hypothetical protein
MYSFRLPVLILLSLLCTFDLAYSYDFDVDNEKISAKNIDSKYNTKRYYIGGSVGIADINYSDKNNFNYSSFFPSSLTSNKIASLSLGVVYSNYLSFELSHDFSGRRSSDIEGATGNSPSKSSSQFSITKLDAFISLSSIDPRNHLAIILGLNRTVFQANYYSSTGFVSNDLYTNGSALGYNVGVSYIHDVSNDLFTRFDIRYIKNSFGGIVDNSRMYTLGVFLKL